MRTEHIEDHNSSMCKRCGRLNHLGHIHLAGFSVKVPKYSTKVKI